MEDEILQGQPELGQQTLGETPVEDTGSRAPYADYLEGLPSSVIPLVEPAFKKWDSDTGRRFQEVHSQYDSYKPWKQFVDTGVNPTDAQNALVLYNELQQNPERVYKALSEAYNFGAGEQGQNGTQQGIEDGFVDPDDLANDPRFAGLQDMTRTMAEYLVGQEQAKQQAATDAQVDAELKALKEKYGDYDERFVLTQMMNGVPGDKAVEAFNNIVENAMRARQRPAAPVIMSSGGGVPSSPVDVSKSSSKQVKDLVAQMLAQAQEQ